MKPPLCRYCGKPLKKYTHLVRFGEESASRFPRATHRSEKPINKAEAQRLLNHQILAVRYDVDYRAPIEERTPFVKQVTIWDGESYERKYFCKDECAQNFGFIVARDQPDLATESYWEALKKQG